VYVQGDFTKSFDYFETLESNYGKEYGKGNKNGDYRLFTCNCVTKSHTAFMMGTLPDGTPLSSYVVDYSQHKLESFRPNSYINWARRAFLNNAYTKESFT
jgi:hypothetical protein